MPGNNSLTITLTQREDGEVLSTTTLDYPSLENATANVLSMDLIEAVRECVAKWGEAKATMIGEEELYEVAQTIRKGQMKKTEPKGPPNDLVPDVGRGILR